MPDASSTLQMEPDIATATRSPSGAQTGYQGVELGAGGR
jgi:hypothetical protein